LKDGAIVQQGEPQNILLNPCDPYIEDFVSDINRGRVLRVGSVMQDLQQDSFDGDVSVDSNLESLIAKSDGDTSQVFRVLNGDKVVGQLDMKVLVRALVPRISGQPRSVK
jgi:glycine betaine/proline transport system ATP-binding protein